MPKRSAVLLILLLLLAAGPLCAAPTDASDASDAGLKATEQSEEGQPNVPASSEWGIMLMVTLVLTASTVALLGGGLTQRRAHEFAESMHRNGIEFQPADPEPKKTEKARESKRSRTRHNKPKLDPEQLQLGRKSWHLSRRQNPHGRPGGRRSGPGCRGVR